MCTIRSHFSLLKSNPFKTKTRKATANPAAKDRSAMDSDKTLHDAMYENLREQASDEYQRLHMQQDLLQRAMGGNMILAPLSTDSPLRVLDSATSDGYWMLQVSKTLPEASTFLGTDVASNHFSNLQGQLPPSISFATQSIFEPWPEHYSSSFDLVHQKYCLPMCQPPVAAEAVRKLLTLAKPGGWIQLVEVNLAGFDKGGQHQGFEKLVEFTDKSYSMAKLNPNPARYLKGWLEEAGAVEVQERQFAYGLGAAEPETQWAVKGEVTIMSMIDMYEQIAARMPGYFYTPEDFAKLKASLRDELRSVGNTWRFTVAWGRRPT